MTTLLVDGDILIYQITSAVEQPIHWGNDWWSMTADAKLAREMVDQELSGLQETLEAEGVLIALSDQTNWRHAVLPTYKWNRKGKRKPVIYVPIREYLISAYPTACFKTLEADDVMGVLATDDTIIVSDDKDLQTIPGRLYRPATKELKTITPEEADRSHLIQALTGDVTDGYKGCPKVGPVSAEKILEEGTWEEVVGAYQKAGLGEEFALSQARVARILREGEWNPITEEVQLWNPK
tara:strand:- start:8450 stop:9163 length:714 start_codon:yes stop_codon:yes gene_type:complete